MAGLDLVVVDKPIGCGVGLPLPNRLHSAGSAEDLQGFFDRGEAIGGDQYGGRVAMPRPSGATKPTGLPPEYAAPLAEIGRQPLVEMRRRGPRRDERFGRLPGKGNLHNGS